MEKFKKTQIAELLLVAALLVIITPLLSTASLRSASLYLVVNIIIIAVAVEAGLLSFFLGNQKPAALSGVFPYCKEKMDGANKAHQSAMVTRVVQKCSSDIDQPPSIFFIGDHTGETDTEAIHVEGHDEAEEVGEVISGQELFQKAEIFIGNFYKQLNIQRDESWKKLIIPSDQKPL